MADISGDALLPLADSERDTALIGGVTDATANNKLFGMTFAELAAAQQRVSPLSVSVERTLLVEYSGVNTANRAQQSVFPTINANNLAIKEGSQRHSFDDGYFGIEVHVLTPNPEVRAVTFIPITDFNAPENSTDHLPRFRSIRRPVGGGFTGTYLRSIYRVSSTAFAVNWSGNSEGYLKAIYGLRYVVSV